MDHSKRLRKEQTEAEHRLWQRLRNHQLGMKFRRQHRIGGYIVDFACLEAGVVVELDGSQHLEQVEADTERTAFLEAHGMKVLRFWNDDVLLRTDAVLDAIWHAVQLPQQSMEQPAKQPAKQPPHPNPLPRRRGRGGKSGSNNSNSNGNGNSNRESGREGSNKISVVDTASDPSEAWQPNASLDALRLRARLNAQVRAFFAQRDVLEVETPVLSQAGNTEPNIESFTTQFTGHVSAGACTRWLRTSPEYPLKRLLAAGIGDCYELGRVFRNGEAGGRHNPEFTMLEWYRVGWDHVRLAEETVALVQGALALVGRSATVQSLSYRALFQRTLQLDPFSATLEQLQHALGDVQLDPDGLGRDDWLDLLVTHRIQPHFDLDTITIVHDWPASQAALARIRWPAPTEAGDGFPVAERFELYLGAVELANGYHELRDATEQRARFSHDNQRRAARGLVQPPPDGHLLGALPLMPHCAGVAVGMDRLLMAMLGTSRIADVLAFEFAGA